MKKNLFWVKAANVSFVIMGILLLSMLGLSLSATAPQNFLWMSGPAIISALLGVFSITQSKKDLSVEYGISDIEPERHFKLMEVQKQPDSLDHYKLLQISCFFEKEGIYTINCRQEDLIDGWMLNMDYYCLDGKIRRAV